jgi:5,10-methylenetetrahydrofolate reductase
LGDTEVLPSEVKDLIQGTVEEPFSFGQQSIDPGREGATKDCVDGSKRLHFYTLKYII